MAGLEVGFPVLNLRILMFGNRLQGQRSSTSGTVLASLASFGVD